MNNTIYLKIENLLYLLAVEKEIDDAEITVKSDVNGGDGFLGNYYIAEVKGKDKKLDVFIKTIRIAGMYLQNIIKYAYLNEFVFYDIIYPEFVKYEEKKGVKEIFRSIPKCYKIHRDDGQETIFLENLKIQGFKQHNRKEPMNDEHIKLVLEELAHFHSISFAIKNENEEKFKELVKNVCCVNTTLNLNDFSDTMEYISNYALARLDPIRDNKYYDIFKDFTLNVSDILKSLDDLVTNNIVVTHGDLHNNNLMFKYHNGSPKEVRIFDWQLMRLTTPIVDVSLFFYSSCNEDQLKRLDNFLQIYHNKLTDCVQNLIGTKEPIYSYETFLNEWKIFARYGLVVGFLLQKILLTDADVINQQKLETENNIPSMKDIMASFELQNSREWERRIKALISHFIESDFLKPINFCKK
nr:uncharacterized protein LOC111429208 isoform X1 [Onthophagus taurus]XP_022920824.1 uncharacterized protein LOC111429208 isoform X1 [Onthophagus taurus]